MYITNYNYNCIRIKHSDIFRAFPSFFVLFYFNRASFSPTSRVNIAQRVITMAQYSLSVQRGAFAHCEKGTGCVEVSATVPRARAKELSLPLLISPGTFRERARTREIRIPLYSFLVSLSRFPLLPLVGLHFLRHEWENRLNISGALPHPVVAILSTYRCLSSLILFSSSRREDGYIFQW